MITKMKNERSLIIHPESIRISNNEYIICKYILYYNCPLRNRNCTIYSTNITNYFLYEVTQTVILSNYYRESFEIYSFYYI